MEPSLSRLNYLLQQYQNGEATPKERLELMEIVRSGELEAPVRQWLSEVIEEAPEGAADELGEERAEVLLSNILQAGRVEDGLRPIRRWAIWKMAAAAAVLFVIGFSAFWTGRRSMPVAVAVNDPKPKQDVLPGKHAAVLTLGNGQQVLLDSGRDGTVGHVGNLTVINTQGMLSYKGLPAGSSAENTYNTLTTNAGNQYQLILPDGSKVWLNAASSIKYPVAFGSRERKVEITGEAYFEVSASASRPVIVAHGNTVVQVLGTNFNMNTYEDESVLTTTLLQGAIRIGQGANSRLIRPGQQARLNANGTLTVVDDVNTEEVVAWKNDLFYFRSADMPSIMRQLTRWYGIRVEGNTNIQERFYAKIPKSAKLTEVLNAFSLTEKVHFDIEGKTVKIKP